MRCLEGTRHSAEKLKTCFNSTLARFHSTCLLFVLTFDFNIFNNPFNKHQKSNQKINFTFDVDVKATKAAVNERSLFYRLQVFIRLSMKLKYQRKKSTIYTESVCARRAEVGKKVFMSFSIPNTLHSETGVTRQRKFLFYFSARRPPSSNSSTASSHSRELLNFILPYLDFTNYVWAPLWLFLYWKNVSRHLSRSPVRYLTWKLIYINRRERSKEGMWSRRQRADTRSFAKSLFEQNVSVICHNDPKQC